MINYDIPNYTIEQMQSGDKTPIKGWEGLKSFDDLEFGEHPGFVKGKAILARLKFGSRDQFEISAVQNVGDGKGLYGHERDGDYEVAMWFDNRERMLPLSVGDDVLAGQTPTDITRLMHQAHLNDFAWVTLLHEVRDEFRKDLGLDD